MPTISLIIGKKKKTPLFFSHSCDSLSQTHDSKKLKHTLEVVFLDPITMMN